MEWVVLIIIVVIGFFVFMVIRKKRHEEALQQKDYNKFEQIEKIQGYYTQEKSKKFSTAITSLSIDESRIEKRLSVLGSKLVVSFISDYGVFDEDLINYHDNLAGRAETRVCFIGNGFIIFEFPPYNFLINYHDKGQQESTDDEQEFYIRYLDIDIKQCMSEVNNLEIKTTILTFDDIIDITYSDKKTIINSGSSELSGRMSGKTTSSTLHMSDGNIGASFGKGTFDGEIAMDGRQGGLTKELTSEASIEIFIESRPDPIELKLTPIDVSDDYTMAQIEEDTVEFIKNSHEGEAEVAKLKSLFQEMIDHMKRKETLQVGQKKHLEAEKYASSSLSDDAYKIFLTKEFEIQKNDVLEKFVVDEKLFDTVEEALEHADGLYRSSTN